MCPAHTSLLQNPVLALHRAANMPKISYIYIFELSIAKHTAGRLVNSVPLTCHLHSYLGVNYMFSSKLFTQISLRIKTGGVYIQFLIYWLKLHTKVSAWLWIEAGKLCCMKSHHWEKTPVLFILHTDISSPLPTETKPPLTSSLLCWFPAGFLVVPSSGKGWITAQHTKSSLFSTLCESLLSGFESNFQE